MRDLSGTFKIRFRRNSRSRGFKFLQHHQLSDLVTVFNHKKGRTFLLVFFYLELESSCCFFFFVKADFL